MAGRTQNKAKFSPKSATASDKAKSPKASTPPTSPVGEGVDGMETRLKLVEVERDQLAAQLELAKQEITALKAKHLQAVNQIDWVLDSLHNIVDEKH
ncbi:MAG: hypothetical protein ACRBCJ_07795 [Hyphomicrobiaceae bacterium]